MNKTLLKPFQQRLAENKKESEEVTKKTFPLERKASELEATIAERQAALAEASAAAERLSSAGAAQMLGDITEAEWSKAHDAAQHAALAAKGAEQTIADATRAKTTNQDRLNDLQAKGKALIAARQQIVADAVMAIAAPAVTAALAAEDALHEALQEMAALSELLRSLNSPNLGYDHRATYVLKVPRFKLGGTDKAFYPDHIRAVAKKLREELIAEGFEIPDLRVLDAAAPRAPTAPVPQHTGVYR